MFVGVGEIGKALTLFWALNLAAEVCQCTSNHRRRSATRRPSFTSDPVGLSSPTAAGVSMTPGPQLSALYTSPFLHFSRDDTL
jgi:hypothetical protein